MLTEAGMADFRGGTGTEPMLLTAHVDASDRQAAAKLRQALGMQPFAVIFLFISPEADLGHVASSIAHHFAGELVVGCTTAGEISPRGYTQGEIVAIGLRADFFVADAIMVGDLTNLGSEDLIGRLIRLRQTLAGQRPHWDDEFAFLMSDGMAMREDELMAALAPGLGPLPLFGGSAGDGVRFERSFVFRDGKMIRNAAIVTLVRTCCRVRVFSLDHLRPSQTRMVVTAADPARRLVREINGEPAAEEYARLVGRDPGQLTPFTFAAHPVVVRLGGRHHVRSIRQVMENGDLAFYSAIDEGLVLTLAEPEPIVEHLERTLAGLSAMGRPEAIIACDCILRRMEAEEKQLTGRLSAVLRANRVIGFSTYGEQLHTMHVNQTMTGVALYPPSTLVSR